jgi:signal transduction histidine kinase
MYPQNLLTGLGLLAASAALVWLRTGHGHPAKARRERLRVVGWSTGLLFIALTVIGAFQPRRQTAWRWSQGWHEVYGPDTVFYLVLGLSVAAAAIVVLAPALGRRLVPAALIGLGAEGLAVAPTAGRITHWTWSYLTFEDIGRYHLPQDLVLPAGYALIALGGWLLWRRLAGSRSVTRLAAGLLRDPARRGAPWALLLVPVTVMIGMLVIPGRWVASGGLFSTAAAVLVLTAVAALVIRRAPALAAGLATGGLLALAAAGLAIASSWPSWPGPRTPIHDVLLGAVAVSGRSQANWAVVQAVVFIGVAVWLAPRAIPQLRPLFGLASHAELARRVQRLTESRAVAVSTAAADVRRLERDLHDGAQARLVALGMQLRVVERLIPASPEAALALVAEARDTSARALTELRELVRGVHPPVLADRGLGDAVRALALDTPLRVETEVSLPGRLPAPIETACYFAVAEVLTNAVKHSGAKEARVSVIHADGLLRVVVTDFGLGGADPARGSGLAGVEKRLATFDGILAVSSPAGGPTMIVMEVPCASSSPKISSC